MRVIILPLSVFVVQGRAEERLFRKKMKEIDIKGERARGGRGGKTGTKEERRKKTSLASRPFFRVSNLLCYLRRDAALHPVLESLV